jgi:hypothetical protein
VWTILSVVGVPVASQVLNVAADALTNDFVSAEHREP